MNIDDLEAGLANIQEGQENIPEGQENIPDDQENIPEGQEHIIQGKISHCSILFRTISLLYDLFIFSAGIYSIYVSLFPVNQTELSISFTGIIISVYLLLDLFELITSTMTLISFIKIRGQVFRYDDYHLKTTVQRYRLKYLMILLSTFKIGLAGYICVCFIPLNGQTCQAVDNIFVLAYLRIIAITFIASITLIGMAMICLICYIIWEKLNELNMERNNDNPILNVLDRVPSRVLNMMPISKVPPDDVCVICLDIGEEGCDWRIMPCEHKIHTECGDHWIKKYGICPKCKNIISADKIKKAKKISGEKFGTKYDLPNLSNLQTS